jgi:hypothetical protein
MGRSAGKGMRDRHRRLLHMISRRRGGKLSMKLEFLAPATIKRWMIHKS